MPSSTVENYLKQIYLEELRTESDLVPMGILASSMGVVPGTATSMVKGLSETGYVAYEPREGIKLTAAGQEVALGVLRRHRLVESLLVEVLGLDWSEVHEEAEALEHVISDRVLERIDQLLGHPTVDPHGDPIPTAKGRVDEPFLIPLPEQEESVPCRVARVVDQDPGFLQYLERIGLVLDTALQVQERIPAGEAMVVEIGSPPRTVTLSLGAAARILVKI